MILRFRLGDRFEHGAWRSDGTTSGSTSIAILWVAFISFIFLLPPYKSSVPWADEFSWEALELRADPRGRRTDPVFGGW